MILVIILYVICALMFTISKSALEYSQPIFFMAIRMLLAGILLGGYTLIHAKIKKKELMFDIKQDWRIFAQLTLFHIYLTYICDLCALKYLQTGQSAFLYNLSPFLTALFSYFWFGEIMTTKKWVGLSLGFISLLPAIYNNMRLDSSLFIFFPVSLTIAAVISSSYGWILVRNLVKERGYSSIFINSFAMFFGGLLALFTSILTEPWTPTPVTHWVPFLQATALIIIVANILFYNLYGYLLKFYTATFLSFAGFMCPIYTGLLGWLILGEKISFSLIFSFALVTLGLFIFYQEELSQGYTK